jgi:hypothetical protein
MGSHEAKPRERCRASVLDCGGPPAFAALWYLFSVAAGVPPAVEPGILPGGLPRGLHRHLRVQSCHSGRQDAALYGSQDGCRYSRKPTLNRYWTGDLGRWPRLV